MAGGLRGLRPRRWCAPVASPGHHERGIGERAQGEEPVGVLARESRVEDVGGDGGEAEAALEREQAGLDDVPEEGGVVAEGRVDQPVVPGELERLRVGDPHHPARARVGRGRREAHLEYGRLGADPPQRTDDHPVAFVHADADELVPHREEALARAARVVLAARHRLDLAVVHLQELVEEFRSESGPYVDPQSFVLDVAATEADVAPLGAGERGLELRRGVPYGSAPVDPLRACHESQLGQGRFVELLGAVEPDDVDRGVRFLPGVPLGLVTVHRGDDDVVQFSDLHGW